MNTIDVRSLTKKWFADSTPKNYKDASTTIGAGTNGVVTINALNDISEDKNVKVVVATGNSKPLSVAFATGTLTITLGTDDTGAADDTKNTALLIEKAINKVNGFLAKASGTGATAISSAVTSKAFTAGQLGTPCSTSGVALEHEGTYYVCTKPNATVKNANWKTFTLVDY